jgi:hypothetical protein
VVSPCAGNNLNAHENLLWEETLHLDKATKFQKLEFKTVRAEDLSSDSAFYPWHTSTPIHNQLSELSKTINARRKKKSH